MADWRGLPDFEGAPNIKPFLSKLLGHIRNQLLRDQIFFFFARSKENQELAQALLASGPLYTKDFSKSRLLYKLPNRIEGCSKLLISATKEQNYRLMKALIDVRANVNYRENTSTSALEYAAYNGDAQAVTILANAGAHLEFTDKNYGRTALHIACDQLAFPCIQALLEAGAQIRRETCGHGRFPTDYLSDLGKKSFFVSLARSIVKRYGSAHIKGVKRASLTLWSKYTVLRGLQVSIDGHLSDIFAFCDDKDVLALSLYELTYSRDTLRKLILEMPQIGISNHAKLTAFEDFFAPLLIETRPRTITFLLEATKRDPHYFSLKELFPDNTFAQCFKVSLANAQEERHTDVQASSSTS